MEDITLNQLQSMVDDWITTKGVRYFSELTNLGILMEEVGELSRIMVRKYGEQSFKKGEKAESLPDELADVLFVLICIANQTGVNLQGAMEAAFAKRNTRDSARHTNNPKLTSNQNQ